MAPGMEGTVNILNKQPRTNDMGWYSSLGVEVGLTTFIKKIACYETFKRASDLDGLFG
jgi:hypothetical protein